MNAEKLRKTKTLYDRNKLLALLPGYKYRKIKTVIDSEDWVEEKIKTFITNNDDIYEVDYTYGFGISVSVKATNTENLHLYSNNISFRDKEVERITKTPVISPAVIENGEYIEKYEALETWLINQGISKDDLCAIESTVTVDTTIEYDKVPTPNIHHSKTGTYYSYSSENLKLTTKEILEILNSVEDELLRLKLECLLTAHIFKEI